MATLHFDTEQGRSTSTQMATCQSTVDSELNRLRNNVNNLVGSAWIGNSATQFQQEFGSWTQQVTNVLQQLADLQSRLDREIVEWETAASALQ